MLRDKSLVIICHCVINQNSVVIPLARAKGSFNFVKQLIDEGLGIIQLPCPEFKHLGITRKPMEKEEYDTKEYRSLCKDLAISAVNDIEVYLNEGYEIKGIVGIEESPTCSISGKRGIFMEELLGELGKRNIQLSYVEVPADYSEKKASMEWLWKKY